MAITQRNTLTVTMPMAARFDAPFTGGPPVDNATAIVLTDGTGSGQADIRVDRQVTILAGATQQLDLAGGSLTQADGAPVTMARLKVIMVRKVSGSGTFSVRRPAANGVPIFLADSDGSAGQSTAGDVFLFVSQAGVTVTAGTGDLIDITETGGASTVTVHYTLIGTSA